jgi:hypothetical protein
VAGDRGSSKNETLVLAARWQLTRQRPANTFLADGFRRLAAASVGACVDEARRLNNYMSAMRATKVQQRSQILRLWACARTIVWEGRSFL